MATETALAKVNVFSSVSQYNENAGSLGADEISLVPADELKLPTGTVIAFAANSAPDGFLLCNGAAISRSTYAALYAKIGTTYGSGDGSTTFNLPNLIAKFIEGGSSAGAVKSAGLPNINGSFANNGHAGRGNHDSGAFITTKDSTGSNNGAASDGGTVTFDASRSNSIYGASATVQPPAVVMKYYIKY